MNDDFTVKVVTPHPEVEGWMQIEEIYVTPMYKHARTAMAAAFKVMQEFSSVDRFEVRIIQHNIICEKRTRHGNGLDTGEFPNVPRGD